MNTTDTEPDDWQAHVRQAVGEIPYPPVRDALRCVDVGPEAMTVTLPGPSGDWVLSLRRSWSRGRREQPCVMFASTTGASFRVIIGPGKMKRLRAVVIGHVYMNCPFPAGPGDRRSP
ncbi:hypothetical protein [Gemmata sp.]|uniref:hypothetical protein n=1 Tax=Gemmata sp. TaxID=1914242 RepID=UPI003F6E7404